MKVGGGAQPVGLYADAGGGGTPAGSVPEIPTIVRPDQPAVTCVTAQELMRGEKIYGQPVEAVPVVKVGRALDEINTLLMDPLASKDAFRNPETLTSIREHLQTCREESIDLTFTQNAELRASLSQFAKNIIGKHSKTSSSKNVTEFKDHIDTISILEHKSSRGKGPENPWGASKSPLKNLLYDLTKQFFYT